MSSPARMVTSVASPPVDVEDAVLASRAARDFTAFETLYRRYVDSVYRFVRSQTPDDATAEDLTAQVFFKALASAETYRGDGAYRSWLFRIAHNSLSTWRSNRSRGALVLEELPEAPDPDPSPAAHAITNDARGAVWRQVADLPPAQREVVALRYLEDLSIEEIARVTHRTRGAVRILLHRARARLRSALEGKDVL